MRLRYDYDTTMTRGVARNLLRGTKEGVWGTEAGDMLNIRLNVAIDRHKSRTVQSPIILWNKKAQLSLTNPRDACEKFARFT